MNELSDLLRQILTEHPYKIVVSKPAAKTEPYRRVEIERKNAYFQIASYTEKQVFHENVSEAELSERCAALLGSRFLQLHAWTAAKEYALLLSRKGKASLQTRTVQPQAPKAAAFHNRKKQYLLEEGTAVAPLVDMGVFTKEGKVVHSMQDKFRQINRFLEMIDDTLRDLRPKSLRIIDFGCGKSYLTFVVYYYLTVIREIDAEMIGLDLKEDVIQKCNAAARKYGYRKLRFELGDINGFAAPFPVDMVITLHACDTATDYALYNAVRWNAKLIFSVPCCQHELNGQMQPEHLTILKRYGIVQERFAALLTDAIRGNLLTANGYKTQLLEFVDFAHTPKNIMIRAVRSPMLPAALKRQAKEEAEAAMAEFHVTPALYRLLQ